MLYIFNKDEQLQAVLKNEGTACPYYDAVHTEKLSGENAFTFTVPADHPDSQYVTEGNLVAFKDLDLNWQLFEIKRVIDVHGDGLTRTAYCEHVLYELIDDFIEDVRPTDCSAAFALTQALTGTRWSVGTIADLGLNSTNFYYESALSAVQKVADVWKGELQFRVVVEGGIISARYVDLLTRRGVDTGKQFAYGRHTKNIEREVDLTTVATALYGRGKGEAVETGGYGRRTTFASVEWSVANGDPVDKPAGQEWVGDPDALAQWGRPGGRHRFGVYEDPEETDPAVLLQKTWDALQERKNPRVTYRLNVVDLERLSGYEHEKVRLGDTVRVIDCKFNPALLVEARVIEINRDLLQPENTSITLGNFAPDLATDALKQQQVNQTVGDRQGVWDRATQFNQDGTLNTSWLTGTINTLQNEVLAGNGTVTMTDNNGILIVDDPDNPTKALRLLGGLLAIANEKDPVTGNWIWRTFGTGDGFTADELNAGQIRTSLIKIFGNSNFYWDGDYLYIVNPANLNEQIRLSKEGIRFTKDGGQTWLVAMDFSGLRMEGQSQDGHTNYTGDGVKVYDEAGNLVGHLGSFETLGPQTATFSRNSVAYKQDGTQVAANQPRFEYHALPYPIWQDTFDIDQLSQYTSGGDTPATWAVSGGVLTGTGGTQAQLIKNDLLLQNCEIVVNSDQAHDGGIVARWQDHNNYYLLTLRDDSGAVPAANLQLYKRVGGIHISLASVNLTWPRGTSKQIKFTLHGSRLEAYFDGVKVISVTDTTFTGGGVGLRHHGSTGSDRYLDFTVYYAQQGVVVEESTSNLVRTNAGADPLFNSATGWTFFGQGASIANGVLTLKSPDGTTVSGCQCTLTNLAQNTKHSFLIRARYKDTSGTANILVLDLCASGYDNATQELDIYASQLTTAFQNFKKDGFGSQAAPSSVNLRIFTFSTRPIEVEFVQLEQKAYATTVTDGSRAAEVITAPTAEVFQKGNWTVKLRYTPTSSFAVMNRHLWRIEIDANNNYAIWIDSTGKLNARVRSGGTSYLITDSTPLTVGNSYLIMFAGNNSAIRFCKNGAQIGSDIAYVEPVGTLPANMYIGCYAGDTEQANGLLSDFAVMSRAQTLAEHQAEYNSGLPLSVDDATTYLMRFDGTLQPTVRRFGLWAKNGEISLVAPPVEGGIRVYDASGNLRTHIGQYAPGKYGAKVINGEIYSTLFKTGTETATSYITLKPGFEPLLVVENGKTALTIWSANGGMIQFYNTVANDMRGQILPYNDAIGQGLRIHGRNNAGTCQPVHVWCSAFRLDADTRDAQYHATVGGHWFYGDLRMGSGTKYNIEETVNYGKRLLAVRESPEQKYIDEGKAQLVNGECRVAIDPIFLECIEPNTDDTPWLIHLTPYADIGIYVAEIGTDYFIVKERGGGISNSVFAWSLSATRKNHAFDRLPEVI